MPRYISVPNKTARKHFQNRFHGTENLVCPQCGTRAEKIFSAPNIHFRGSGFYVSDSKKNQRHQRKRNFSNNRTTKSACFGWGYARMATSRLNSFCVCRRKVILEKLWGNTQRSSTCSCENGSPERIWHRKNGFPKILFLPHFLKNEDERIFLMQALLVLLAVRYDAILPFSAFPRKFPIPPFFWWTFRNKIFPLWRIPPLLSSQCCFTNRDFFPTEAEARDDSILLFSLKRENDIAVLADILRNVLDDSSHSSDPRSMNAWFKVEHVHLPFHKALSLRKKLLFRASKKSLKDSEEDLYRVLVLVSKRKAHKSNRGVWTNTRELLKFYPRLRENSHHIVLWEFVLFEKVFPGVIAKLSKREEDLLPFCICETQALEKRSKKRVVIDHTRNLQGLLKHDFRNPNTIRIRSVRHGKTSVLPIPGKNCRKNIFQNVVVYCRKIS